MISGMPSPARVQCDKLWRTSVGWVNGWLGWGGASECVQAIRHCHLQVSMVMPVTVPPPCYHGYACNCASHPCLPLRRLAAQVNIIYNTTLKYILYEPCRPKGFFQFEIIINVLVSSFRFIWIPMLSTTIIFCLVLSARGLSLDVRF